MALVNSSTSLNPNPSHANNGSGSTSSALSGPKVSAALKKVKGNFERFFEKNLADMIRGIRNNKEHEAKYIAQCIEEIKLELKQDSIMLKANAIAKLSYLQMLGYDISWASFNVIEVMSSTKFTYKRIGYLAAAQCFNDNTDVLMLTTNMIRKDLNSAAMYESGLALGGLACFVTHDLARDLANDVVTLLTSSKPYVRKRAVLLLYKIFLRYPDALRPTFPRLKEKLEDPDQGVQSSAVNVICELARKNPKNYLSLAPIFFKLMTSSTNNWMLIKIIKLFGALTPFEPRLGKKLIEPLTNLINSTSAMSLLYECINTVIAVLISISSEAPGNHTASIQLCVQKLSALIEDSDQNLKYLGLLAMGKILQTHPKAVQVHKDLIMACLDDKDESIRLRALDLLYGMVSKKNIMEIVKRLLSHVEKAEGSMYRDELLSKIVQICSHNSYQHISNFEWYISVLVELTKVEGTKHGPLIAGQMLDVAVRVPSIRHFAVSQTALLIENAHLLLTGNYQHRHNMCEVLQAAAWICGEYSEHVRNPQIVLESLLRTKLSLMPGHVQSSFVQNIGKIYARMLSDAEKEDDWDKVYSLDNLVSSKLPVFEQSDCLEAQERACSFVQLAHQIDQCHKRGEKVAEDIMNLFEGDLGPVASKAQKKVPVPTDLDLEEWINEPIPESSSESEPDQDQIQSQFATGTRPMSLNVFGNNTGADQKPKPKVKEMTEAELKKQKEARKAEMESNPHYLKSGVSSSSSSSRSLAKTGAGLSLANRNASFESNNKVPEIQSIDLQSPLDIPGMIGLDKYMEQQEKTMSWKSAKENRPKSSSSGTHEKKRKNAKKTGAKKAKGPQESSGDEDNVVERPAMEVNRGVGEMPEGARSTDDEDEKRRSGGNEQFKALNIDLDEPLRPEERLPVLHHRITPPPLPSKNANPEMQTTNSTKTNVKKSVKKKNAEIAKTGTEKPKGKKSTKKTNVQPESPSNGVDLWLQESEIVENPIKKQHSEEKVEKKRSSKKDPSSSSEAPKLSGAKKEKRSGAKKAQPSLLLATPSAAALDESPSKRRGGYEQTSGLCTPTEAARSLAGSARHSPAPRGDDFAYTASSNKSFPLAEKCRVLARNPHLLLKFETSVRISEPDRIVAKMTLQNLTDAELSRIELEVLDTMNLKIVKTSNSDSNVKLPNMQPRSNAEVELKIQIAHFSPVPQKLRGSLTYFFKTSDGSTAEKLDFQLHIKCIDFILASTTSSDSFAEMLASGELTGKVSQEVQLEENFLNNDFDRLLKFLTDSAKLTIVEKDEAVASLYGTTLNQSGPICILLKKKDSSLKIDGKSADFQLITNIVQELCEILTNNKNS